MIGDLTELVGQVTSPVKMQAVGIRVRLRRAGMRPQRLDLPGCSVRVWVGGRGRPLLLLHGFGANAMWVWHPQIPALASRFRLIVPDLLGFGRSHRFAGEPGLEMQARTMSALLDALDVHRCDLMGISYGGFVAWQLAHEHPSRFERVALVGCPGPVMDRADYDALLARFGADDIVDVLQPKDTDGVRRLIEVAWHTPPPTPGFALRDALKHLFTDQVEEKRALLRDLLSRVDEPRTEPPLPHEALLVWGAFDPIFPVSIGLRLQRFMGPTARLHVIPRSAHAPNLERVKTFNALVGDFLDRRHP